MINLIEVNLFPIPLSRGMIAHLPKQTCIVFGENPKLALLEGEN